MSATAQEYLLTDATFHYSGASKGTIHVPQGAPGFRTILPAGDYDGLELLDGWWLQRNSAAGYVPVAAELVSDNPALFSIQASQVSPLSFQFKTGSQLWKRVDLSVVCPRTERIQNGTLRGQRNHVGVAIRSKKIAFDHVLYAFRDRSGQVRTLVH